MKKGFKTHTMRVTTSSKKHKWRSDPKLVALIEEFARGKIGLDPCASRFEKHHFAEENYTLHNGKDGLVESWIGRGVTYANPEYKRSLIVRFIRKAIDEFVAGVERDKKGKPLPGRAAGTGLRCGKSDHLFLLVPARADTKWFQDELLPTATAICFWRGRFRFGGKKGKTKSGKPKKKNDPAPFPSMILYFGRKPRRFRKLFSPHGWVPR